MIWQRRFLNVALVYSENYTFDSLVALCCILNCRYANRDRLSPEHERTIIEMLLPYHPECEKKIGCGIDYIMVCIMLSRFGNNISLCGHYGHPFTNQA